MSKATKRWSYSAGEWGENRVRVYEDANRGTMYLDYSERRADGTTRRERISLGHADREKAKAQADEAAAQFRSHAPRTAQLTLRELFESYEREVTPSKSEGKQKHDRRCAGLFLRCFGDGRHPDSLTRREWDRFIQDRRSGKLRPEGSKPRRVRDRVIAYDLSWLLAVLNWATMASDGRGGVLLERNPLRGLSLPREESPRRPVLGHEQYEALRAIAREVSPLFDLALVLAHETGHRIGAIRQLRWSDIDLQERTVRWRGELDKIGAEHVTPLTAPASEFLEQLRRCSPAIGDAWLFPAPSDPAQPCSRHLLRDWWERAAKRARLPEGQRFGYHSLRRQFASELKETPLADLAYLGGWKDPQTILKCYQRPDADTMRRALEQRRPLRAGSAR